MLVADLDRDGNDDILARNDGNWWVSVSNATTFDASTLWASWADLPWDEFAIKTTSSNALFPGTPTLFGFIDGEWWARINATNDGFRVPDKWATLPNADYDAVKLFDYDGDNGSDFAVLSPRRHVDDRHPAQLLGNVRSTSRPSNGLIPIGRTSASATSTATDATTFSLVLAVPGGSCGMRMVRSSRPAGTCGSN